MRLTIAIATLAAATLSGCGAGGAAADSSQVSQYAASGAVAAAVSGDRVYIVETRYGTAGQAFTDKKDATIALLRKTVGS